MYRLPRAAAVVEGGSLGVQHWAEKMGGGATVQEGWEEDMIMEDGKVKRRLWEGAKASSK